MANEKRLIDAEAIARKLKNAHCAECNVVRKVQCSACWVEDVLELLEGDAVDAVEVVRCKDCKHSYDGVANLMCGRCGQHINGIRLGGVSVKEEHFCSYGERKDNV